MGTFFLWSWDDEDDFSFFSETTLPRDENDDYRENDVTFYIARTRIMSTLTQSTLLGAKVVVSKAAVAKRTNVVTRAGQYDDELLQTAVRPSFFFVRAK